MAKRALTTTGTPKGDSLALIARVIALLWAIGYCLAAGYSTPTMSAIFACPSGDTVIFQDRPCPEKSVQKSRKITKHRFPMNIHESWFDLPEQARERAFCDRRGCECGRTLKKHQGSLVQAVADALYMDGSWHRYEMAYQAWFDAPTMTSESFVHEDEMLEASCEVMMAQVLLRNYVDDVLAILAKRVTKAKELGFDSQQPCEAVVEGACAYYQSVKLLARMKRDAAALTRIRGEELQPANQPNLAAGMPNLEEMEAQLDAAIGPDTESSDDTRR